jgi:hypothetical protein
MGSIGRKRKIKGRRWGSTGGGFAGGGGGRRGKAKPSVRQQAC